MIKADLAKVIHEKLGFSAEKSAEVVDQFFAILTESLESGEKIKISGFGIFDVRTKKPRIGRNPKTGEPVTISGRTVVAFKPSAILRKALNHKRESEDEGPSQVEAGLREVPMTPAAQFS